VTPSVLDARLGETEGQTAVKSVVKAMEDVLNEIKQALRDEISRAAHEISSAQTEISQRGDEISRHEIEISAGGSLGKGEGYSDLESEQQEVTEISSEISSDEIEISSEIADQPKPLNAKAIAAILRRNPELLKMRGKDLAARFGVTPVIISRARKLVEND
jgi:hypothetical protein